ncbi:MAG: flagellin N-terminal helical domain-containing protein [Gemmatirosa sp.]
MRVTNSLVTRSLTNRLLDNQRLLAEAQERVATGKRVGKMSDDPTAGSAIMQASGQLRALEQYQRNVGTIGARIDAEESALDQVTQLLTRAKELAVGQYGATANADSRTAAAQEVKQLFLQVVAIGNQKFGDDHLFGGANDNGVPPFDASQTLVDPPFVALDPLVVAPDPPATRPPTGRLEVEVGTGQRMLGPHDGTEVFVDTGVLEGLHALQVALETNDPGGIATAMGTMDGAFRDVQSLIGEVGARQNQVDIVRNGLDALTETFTAQKSDLSEVDMERAITEMLSRQTAYQAAMLASSKVMGMSLTDYIR